MPIEFYSSPFVIKGTAYSPNKDPEYIETMGYTFFPIKNATISCGLLNSQFDTINSKLVMVNISISEGFEIGK